ncbi:hypothetical protein [Komagataeibacter swingsii]|uniref:hypothetical protein n=1 Tax=Komagataeibacter swingsii TaxID=215220 RepID=UPI001FCA11AC|nr:hypothetical protein [Komagataeibacter swingsii]
MKLVIAPDRNTACAHVADMLYMCRARNPAAVPGLATGRTIRNRNPCRRRYRPATAWDRSYRPYRF